MHVISPLDRAMVSIRKAQSAVRYAASLESATGGATLDGTVTSIRTATRDLTDALAHLKSVAPAGNDDARTAVRELAGVVQQLRADVGSFRLDAGGRRYISSFDILTIQGRVDRHAQELPPLEAAVRAALRG